MSDTDQIENGSKNLDGIATVELKNIALQLDSGQVLDQVTISYRTFGQLNEAKSNAILICHALTLDQHVAGDNPTNGKPGWWSSIVGPGLPIDTDKFFVICQNVIGGCAGSTGPTSMKPDGSGVYGIDFPVITIADMVRAQNLLLDHLEIPDLFCVLGGSMGGMQTLQWAAAHSERVFCAIPIPHRRAIRRKTSLFMKSGGKPCWLIQNFMLAPISNMVHGLAKD